MALEEFVRQQVVARRLLLLERHFVPHYLRCFGLAVGWLSWVLRGPRLDQEVASALVVPAALLVEFVELGTEQRLLREVKLDLGLRSLVLLRAALLRAFLLLLIG